MAISRQDKISPRTPEQLQRQYQFEKTFAEIMGVANSAQSHAEAAEKEVKAWSQTLETDFSDIRAELNMKLERDKNDKFIGKVHIGADQLTIDTANFKLTESGEVTATAGYIGDWKIQDGVLYSEKTESTETDYSRVYIAPNRIHLEAKKTSYEENKVTLEDGMLKIERTEYNFFQALPRFAEFKYNGTKYALCIDPDTCTLYAFKLTSEVNNET